jgi:hypothetical protein
LEDCAFLVGGQALNIWAERYSHCTELAEYGPFTSKDIDYFGYQQAAQKLAKAIGGKMRTPSADDMTPHSALVTAESTGAQSRLISSLTSSA